jgi:hypothetical protein
MLAVQAVGQYDITSETQKFTKSSGTVSVQLRAYFRACSQDCEKWLLASSCLSLQPTSWNNSAPTGQILMIFECFSKIFRKNSNFIRYGNNERYFTWRCMYIYDSISKEFFLVWEMFQIKDIEIIKTHTFRQATGNNIWCRKDVICMMPDT